MKKKTAVRWALLFIVIAQGLHELSDLFERIAKALEDLPDIGHDEHDEHGASSEAA